MHEVSLVSALVDQIQEVSLAQGFARVLEIRLQIGALSGVEPACVEFCFSEISRGSILEGARLVMEPVGLELSCRSCGHLSFPNDPAELFCAHCKVGDVNILKGRDFKVVDLEVE